MKTTKQGIMIYEDNDPTPNARNAVEQAQIMINYLRKEINKMALEIEKQQDEIDELKQGQMNKFTEKDGWILCSDCLPTYEDGTVLVCYPNVSPYNLLEPYPNAKHDRRVDIGQYSQSKKRWYHGEMKAVGGEDPIAWMPLPKPLI